MEEETQKRPRLNDPKEWKIVHSMYVKGRYIDPDKQGLDSHEINDRMEHGSNRNQSR